MRITQFGLRIYERKKSKGREMDGRERGRKGKGEKGKEWERIIGEVLLEYFGE